MSVKVLHFADAHIDMASGRRRDPQSGHPVRIADTLKAFDTIIDAAIQEKVDLVLFAGDAYRDATPVPTYQREWGKRMMRLSNAGIPTLMIAGNHDSSAASGKASALQEYDTLNVPFLHLARLIELWTPERLDGVPIQVLTLPWIPRSVLVAHDQTMITEGKDPENSLILAIEKEIDRQLAAADPNLPIILLAHYTASGATYPNQQMVTLGRELTLPEKLVRDRRFSYTALGHIHKFQDLNPGAQPPVIYPGSIERMDYGEYLEDKGYIIAEVSNHHTEYRFCKLDSRKIFNRSVIINAPETFQQEVSALLPPADEIEGAMIRLEVQFPAEWEAFFDERALRRLADNALEFKLILRKTNKPRLRLESNESVSSLNHLELLERYLINSLKEEENLEALKTMAEAIFSQEQSAETD